MYKNSYPSIFLKFFILVLLFFITAAPSIIDNTRASNLHQENLRGENGVKHLGAGFNKGSFRNNINEQALQDATNTLNYYPSAQTTNELGQAQRNAADGSVRAFKKNSNNIVLDTQAPSATLGRISTGQPVETPAVNEVAVDLKDLAGNLKDGEEITKNRAIVGGGMNPISRGDMVHDPKVNSSMHQGAMNSVQDRN